jgi:hypothetical protein
MATEAATSSASTGQEYGASTPPAWPADLQQRGQYLLAERGDAAVRLDLETSLAAANLPSTGPQSGGLAHRLAHGFQSRKSGAEIEIPENWRFVGRKDDEHGWFRTTDLSRVKQDEICPNLEGPSTR